MIQKMAQSKSTRVPGVSFRANARERAMIDRAARSKDMGPSDYARRSIMKQVEMDLADETEFSISAAAMTQFMDALDRPADAKPNLRKLLTQNSILD